MQRQQTNSRRRGKHPEKPDTAGLVKHAEALLDGLKKL